MFTMTCVPSHRVIHCPTMNTKIVSAKVQNGTLISLYDRGGNHVATCGAALLSGGETYTSAHINGDIMTAATSRGSAWTFKLEDGRSPSILHRH